MKNLPFDTIVAELEALFINAKEVRLLTQASGKRRGKAFVEMTTVEAAHKAHEYKKWDLRKKRLEVDLCGSKSNNTDADEIKEVDLPHLHMISDRYILDRNFVNKSKHRIR